jgi:hypothetical protein
MFPLTRCAIAAHRVSTGVISAAPQGVTCPTVRYLTSGRCVTELRNYITATGGSYFAAAP